MADADGRERMREIIAAQDAARGRPLTARERLDNLCEALTEITESERFSDADKDSIRARIATDIARNEEWNTGYSEWNAALKAGAIGALTSLLEAIEPWLEHRFDDTGGV